MALGATLKPLLTRGSPSEKIRERFLALNAARLERARLILNARQQLFLDVLPLLFHVNHPVLPGYVSAQTPCGIDQYEPDERVLNRVQRQLAKSFVYRPDKGAQPALLSLFLMGSFGSIAQSESSDIDVWLCHRSDLGEAERELLKQKADALTELGDSLGLEIHFFLMCSEEFRRGEREALTVESCGSTQHYLLLDEFYRTSVLLAGRTPLWWLVPPEEESHYDRYASESVARRRREDSIDFGGITRIPPGEYVGAGIWQLYKAISSPYKSVLKLLLTEAYANEYPLGEPLSLAFKRRLYKGETISVDAFDPYVDVYRKLEHYLGGRREHDRLELVRRCFYFKAGLKLSQRAGAAQQQDWRYALMQNLVQEWGWNRDVLVNLDTRAKWKARRVKEENALLVRELSDSYRFLQDFARKAHATVLISSQEMTVLGRKLYAAFERKPDKVEWLNPGIAPQLTEDELTFYPPDSTGEARWAVAADRFSGAGLAEKATLKHSSHLVGLLCWCLCNGVLHRNTRLYTAGETRETDQRELQALVSFLRRELPDHSLASDPDEHECFTQPKRPVKALLIANAGGHFAPRRSEAESLDWNPVHSIDLVMINSWGEVLTQRFEGERAVVDVVRQLLQQSPPPSRDGLPQLHTVCFAEHGAEQVVTRIRSLKRDALRCYYESDNPPSTRFVLSLGRAFYVLQPQVHDIDITPAGSYSELIERLGTPQRSYSPIVLERDCVPDSALAAILKKARAGVIQVFYFPRDDFADVFISDQHGELHYAAMLYQDERALTASLHNFLAHIARQRLVSGDADNTEAPDGAVETWRLSHSQHQWTLEPWQPAAKARYLGFAARAVPTAQGKVAFDIRCGEQRFNHADHGKHVFAAAARHLIAQADDGGRRLCHITQLDLSPLKGLLSPTRRNDLATWLHYKQLLEEAMNTALLSTTARPVSNPDS